MAKEEMEEGTICFEGKMVEGDQLRQVGNGAPVSKIILRPKDYNEALTRKKAEGFSAFPGLCELEIWCNVERAAINEILVLPGLRRLVIIFEMVGSGRLSGFDKAIDLQEFQCDYGMIEEDFLAISAAPTLRMLRAQNSKPTIKAIAAFPSMPHLRSLDLEASSFDDAMAEKISTSTTITELEIGASQISSKGLENICKMRQLCHLDIWATDINMDDLDLLQNLPDLQYLSLGSTWSPKKFVGQKLIDKLTAFGSLKRLWLDGVDLNESQIADLQEHYEKVTVYLVDKGDD